MKKLTAKTSLTLSSERCNPSFGRRYDVSRTESATKSHAPETSRPGGELDLSAFGTKSGMVLQMVAPLSGGRCVGSVRSFACAENQSARLVEGDWPSHPSDSRPTDATPWAAPTVSFG